MAVRLNHSNTNCAPTVQTTWARGLLLLFIVVTICVPTRQNCTLHLLGVLCLFLKLNISSQDLPILHTPYIHVPKNMLIQTVEKDCFQEIVKIVDLYNIKPQSFTQTEGNCRHTHSDTLLPPCMKISHHTKAYQ